MRNGAAVLHVDPSHGVTVLGEMMHVAVSERRIGHGHDVWSRVVVARSVIADGLGRDDDVTRVQSR